MGVGIRSVRCAEGTLDGRFGRVDMEIEIDSIHGRHGKQFWKILKVEMERNSIHGKHGKQFWRFRR